MTIKKILHSRLIQATLLLGTIGLILLVVLYFTGDLRQIVREARLAIAAEMAQTGGEIRADDLVAAGFEQPLLLTHAGDGTNRLFVVEKAGRIKIIQDGETLTSPFLDLTAVVESESSERGLLGLAFHPGYAVNGRFFVNYTNLAGDTIVAEYRVSDQNPNLADSTSGKEILHVTQPHANHNGGHLAFSPVDKYLYIGLGDGGSANDPEGDGQNPNNLLGTILRLDVDRDSPYAIPPDNPFANSEGSGEIWAFGLRNPWRFNFDRQTGDLYIGDVGQNSWEEIDFMAAGQGGDNFGWNLREGPCSRGESEPCDLADSQFTEPIAYYPTDSLNRSVVGGFVYRGTTYSTFQGTYIFGDFLSGRIWSLDTTTSPWPTPELQLDTDYLISSFGEDEAGELYVVDFSGGVYRLHFNE